MIYTSYFANMKRLGDRNYVSIARYTPKGIIIPSYLTLAPTRNILFQYKKDNNESVYVNRYYEEVLRKLNPKEVAEDLDGCTLLCYEKPENFCHRFIVAEWLKFYGFDCREVECNDKSRED